LLYKKQAQCFMESAGEFLKAERLRKNLTIKELAQRTKIGSFTLVALEADNEELLPPAAYVKGFIKLIARELDFNPDEVLAFYETRVREEPAPAQSKDLKKNNWLFSLPVYAVPLISGAVLLLICALYFGYKGRNSVQDVNPNAGNGADMSSVVQQRDAASASEPEMASAAGQDDAQEAGADNASAAGNPFTVRFDARERSWMRFTVDDKHVFQVMLKPGETYSVNAVSGIKVRIGNPGGLSIFYNDKPVILQGKRGAPVDVSFPEASKKYPISSH
jgi:cytoskeleton protein RodZ